VRAYLLLDPVEGRADGAWVLEYRGQSFLTDPGGGNAQAFTWTGQSRQPIETRAKTKPPLTGFDAKGRDDIARDLKINPALLAFIEHGDPDFPQPIVHFRDGPIWNAEAVERWTPSRKAQPTGRWSPPQI
jgi:hypothetical protein